jgi:hypothetical protein
MGSYAGQALTQVSLDSKGIKLRIVTSHSDEDKKHSYLWFVLVVFDLMIMRNDLALTTIYRPNQSRLTRSMAAAKVINCICLIIDIPG